MEALVMRICIFFILLAFIQPAIAESMMGMVVSISDGDTITILDDQKMQYKIRLSGIDAPEKKQPYGNVSKSNLSKLIYGKLVHVTWNKKDRYGRIIGKVLLGDRDICLVQINDGYAWHYKSYEKEQNSIDRKLYSESELNARDGRRGLWRDNNPTPPWDFRKSIK
jgi:endonuclease YncB( thermonuclease family)